VGWNDSRLCDGVRWFLLSGMSNFEKTIAAGADIIEADTSWLAGTCESSVNGVTVMQH